MRLTIELIVKIALAVIVLVLIITMYTHLIIPGIIKANNLSLSMWGQ